jgi:glucan 1,4-alpha-glucosidase
MKPSATFTMLVTLALGAAGLAAAPATQAAPAAGPAALAQTFDNVGITNASQTQNGDLDGTGDSFDSAALARDGIRPSASFVHDGLTLRWPGVPPGQKDNVLADGQQIGLHGQGNTLGVAATSTGGATSGTLTVTYTDGSTTAATVNVANWVSTSAAAAPAGGESDLLATTGGWNPSGSTPVSLSYLSIPINPAKTVASVTLPAVGSAVGHTTPAMHVFGLTVGTVADRASDGPGDLSYYDLARKDCVGTAPTSTSKTWYTVAGGMLSDVYYPTIDNTNVHNLEYVVTDGSSFTDIQPRDMTYTVSALGASGPRDLACEITAKAKDGAYQIVTDYLTGTGRNSVVMRVRFDPLTASAGRDHLYARLQPLVNGHGGGGSQNAGADSATTVRTAAGPVPVDYSTNSFTEATNRTFATPTYLALAASRPFPATGNGFAGQASDGLTQLSTGHTLAGHQNASDGDVTTTVELPAGTGPTTLTLGFGQSEDAAVSTALASARASFTGTLNAYDQQWQRYDRSLKSPPASIKGVDSAEMAKARAGYWLSANVIKASLDKTFPGAAAAGLASPWGQAVPAGNAAGGLAPYFGSYRETFSRDAYETFTGFLTDGDLADARAIDEFLFDRQQLPNGSLPRNSLPNGQAAPDTGGLQLDETAYPILMAWQAGLGGDHGLYTDHVKPAAEFLVAHGPSDGVERWEEQTGFSPSTIAAEIAGLVAAAEMARQNADPASARVFDATADEFQRDVIAETVTTNGPDSPDPYFIRLSKTGDPNAAITYNLGNGGPTLDQRSVIDAGFLDLARLGELPQNLPLIANSLKVVDATIAASTPSGTGFHRYNGDGYGDANGTGQPWATTDTGTGHPWPVLSGERAEHDLTVGDLTGATGTAGQLGFMLNSSSGVGLVPEQVWEQPDLPASPYGSDPTTASIGFTDGQAAGSAAPLTWATAQEVRLILDLGAGRLLEQPSIVADRYVTHSQGQTPLSLTAPVTETGSSVAAQATVPQATVDGTSVTITGTASPGARVDIAVSDIQIPNDTATTSTVTAGPAGAFTATVAVTAGDQSHVAVTATAAGGGTNAAGFDVTSLATPGTVVLNATGPADGGAGPGNFALPTATSGGTPTFPDGSFTITDFRVARATATTSFQVGIKDLTNPFGGSAGFSLQLVDLYIRQPGLPDFDYSTAATYPSRNYTIAPADAWSQSIEVDGFGRAQWQTALGSSPGTITSVSGNPASGQITITVPTADLGTVGSGWTVTVALAGQDGFGTDDARAFTATPGDFSFGVCSAAEAAQNPEPAVCQVAPSAEPEVMDTVPPAGVSLSSELDVTAGPAVLQGVTVP